LASGQPGVGQPFDQKRANKSVRPSVDGFTANIL
jgi:hypothetical protein